MVCNISEVNFNSFDLISPIEPYTWSITQVDGGQQELRGSNIPITGQDGTLFVNKKKGEAKVTIYMQCKDEDSLLKLKQEVFDRGLHDFTCSPSFIVDQQAECTSFNYSTKAGGLTAIIAVITVPRLI